MNNVQAVLLKQIAQGSQEALLSLYLQYGNLVYAMAYRVLMDSAQAEEITQDVFMAIWRNAEKYDATRAGLTTWLVTITRRRAIDQLRYNAVRPPAQRSDMGEIDSIAPATDVLPVISIRQAVNALPFDQQACIDLIYFKGYTQQEVADELSVPLGTVKGRVRLALEKLRRSLRSFVPTS